MQENQRVVFQLLFPVSGSASHAKDQPPPRKNVPEKLVNILYLQTILKVAENMCEERTSCILNLQHDVSPTQMTERALVASQV